VANLKIIISGIVCMILSAFLYYDYERMFGGLASQPGTTPYMLWFFAAAVIVSLIMILVGLKKHA
jgi:surface polysaccharide O-acyltransferase-like enzyme